MRPILAFENCQHVLDIWSIFLSTNNETIKSRFYLQKFHSGSGVGMEQDNIISAEPETSQSFGSWAEKSLMLPNLVDEPIVVWGPQ